LIRQPRRAKSRHHPAPVVRNAGEREMVLVRWGMPSPPLPLLSGLPFAPAADRELAL
jgi:putative SOS response-associated peptidase YedK